MKKETYIVLIGITLLVIFIYIKNKQRHKFKAKFTDNDVIFMEAINDIKKGVVDVDDVNDKNILIMLELDGESSNSEKYSRNHYNNNYNDYINNQIKMSWPQYFYSNPYNYEYGGWPEDMFTRSLYITPGYYTGTGWKYYLRPNLKREFLPRARWVRKKNSRDKTYYYISNFDYLLHNQNNYSELPLQWK